jgi:CheY-like chemotaxis protein
MAGNPPRRRVVVVEDEFLIRLMLVEMLEDEGYEVVEAENGDLALPLLDASVAVLLTDVQLPGSLDGLALARRARTILPDLPVIFMTGRPASMLSTVGGREIFIGKPYQIQDIRDAVSQMIEG